MTFEEWLAGIIKSKSINVSDMARQTGISYKAIYASLFQTGRVRELRSRELIAICKYAGINPMDFSEKERKG